MQPKFSGIAAADLTENGIPIAKLVRSEEESIPLFGLQKNSVVIKNDIISPIKED